MGKLVYLMARKWDYDDPVYDKALTYCQEEFEKRGYQVEGAKGKWRDASHWLNDWPEYAERVEIGVVVTGESAYIGKGVYEEVCTLLFLGKEVYLCYENESGEMILTKLFRLEKYRDAELDWNRYGKMVPYKKAYSFDFLWKKERTKKSWFGRFWSFLLNK